MQSKELWRRGRRISEDCFVQRNFDLLFRQSQCVLILWYNLRATNGISLSLIFLG